MQDPKIDTGVVYNSGLVIENESSLATLTVFYERIWLPHVDVTMIPPGLMNEVQPYVEWVVKWSALFKEQVLRELPPATPESLSKTGESLLKPQAIEDFGKRLEANWKATSRIIERNSNGPMAEFTRIGFGFLNLHFGRFEVSLPRICDFNQKPDRETLVRLEAFAAFQYLLPKLNALQPDDILELRRRVKDTREGFTMHLQKLSKSLDGMVQNGSAIDDIRAHAKSIVETDLIPDYREFHRQLASERTGKWKKSLDTAGKIMAINAAPWTPKFWGELLNALGMSVLQTAADKKDTQTNRYQAYEFMKEIEEFSQRKQN